MQILKYTLDVKDQQEITLPGDAKVLDIQEQHGKITMWAMGEDASRVPRRFYIVGTGMEFNATDVEYVKTVQTWQGFVWHVFKDRGTE